ncbi:MAG: hypothetical protein NTU53_18865 [Planctomycetota bacterium]|nr:hypothetical protein [Planctomycetota bacterium]
MTATKIPVRFVVLALTMMSAACNGPTRPPSDISVALDREISQPSVRVHLVGVTDGDDLERFNTKGLGLVDDWFKAGNLLRAAKERNNVVKEMILDKDKQPAMVLAADNPIWANWEKYGAKWLVVLANLPASKDEKDMKDTRICILPLDKKRWSDPITISITISPVGVPMHIVPTPNPAKD